MLDFAEAKSALKIISQYGNTSTLFTMDKAWKYTRLVGTTIAKNGELRIPFNEYYVVTWTYDAKALNYLRSINGKKWWIKMAPKFGREIFWYRLPR